MTHDDEVVGNPILRFLSNTVSAVVLLGVAIVVVAAMGELTARAQTEATIDVTLSALRAELLKEFATPTQDDHFRSRDELTNDISKLVDAKASLELLNLTGTGNGMDSEYSGPTVQEIALDLSDTTIRAFNPSRKRTGEDASEASRLLRSYMSFSPAPHFRRETLIAIATTASAVLGVALAGLRRKEGISIRRFAIGVGTGFIVYLVVQGGSFIFLLDLPSEIGVNHYSISLTALLSGLFTERLYKLLSTLVDKTVGDS